MTPRRALSAAALVFFGIGCGDIDTPSNERIINVEAEADDDGNTTQLASASVVDGIEFPFEVRLPDINIVAPSSGEQRTIESMEVAIPDGLVCRVTQQDECKDLSCNAKFEMTD